MHFKSNNRVVLLNAGSSICLGIPHKKRGPKTSFKFSEPDWIRTNDLLLRRQLLYPAELPVQLLVYWFICLLVIKTITHQ